MNLIPSHLFASRGIEIVPSVFNTLLSFVELSNKWPRILEMLLNHQNVFVFCLPYPCTKAKYLFGLYAQY